MKRFLRAVARVLFIVLLALAAALAPFALLPIAVRWPTRREDAIVELVRPDDVPTSPSPHLEVR